MNITKTTQSIEELSVMNKLFLKSLLAFYKPLVKKEIVAANINYSDTILFVGGGSAPYSAILLNELTGANVKIIDKDYKSVLNAQKIIDRYNLKDLTVECCNGKDADYTKYSIVHLALQVDSKQKIVDKIISSTNAKILIRVPKEEVVKIYDEFDYKKYKINNFVEHYNLSNVGKTLIYEG
ncbi:MAG: hypothetical protein MJA82_07270 [Clostridia bacterium]|nr:hypothetical protein [Clostridia bacterium]